jgi:hypothetical protein
MKNLILALLLFFPFSLFAQEGWTSVFIEADSSRKDFEILDTIYVPLYPDSNIINGKTEYKGCPLDKQHNIHGIGQAFDFIEHKWVSVEFDDWAVSTDIDSIFFKYQYHRKSSQEVIDTIIAQISKTNYNSDSSASVSTKKSGLAKEPYQTIKIPLTEVHSTRYDDSAQFFVVALNESVQATNWAITVTFISGIENDSLAAKDTLNSANIFSLASYAVKKNEKPHMRFNNGLLLTTDGKYLDAAYRRSFLELHGDIVELYPVIYFKYNLYYKSISENNENGVEILPTFVGSGEKITINASGFVEASIFDLNGQLLQSSTTDQISTTGLAKGIYLLKLETRTFFTTQRIVVY